jgi:hypothetical protein
MTVMVVTVNDKLGHQVNGKRYRHDNKAWKQHAETRLIPLHLRMLRLSHGWDLEQNIPGRMMNHDLYDTAAHSKLTCNGNETKPPINK